ncbi:MAG TPA: formate dehydrogenase [Casimicrobiaceae bacterium]|nr:formate dehydrogenase [Casimicrobiaceae bacterium]
MQTTSRTLLAAVLAIALSGTAGAKLPPPPAQTPEQKAEAAAKAKAAADKDAAELAAAQNRVAQVYITEQKAKGVVVHPQLPSTPQAAPAEPAKK